MKIYVIYSFSDIDVVNRLVQYLYKIIPEGSNSIYNENVDIFHFPAETYRTLRGELWKKTAWENMLDSNIILFCLGTTFSRISDNILWEVSLAGKLQKEIYLLKLDEDLYSKINQCSYVPDIFSEIESQFKAAFNTKLNETPELKRIYGDKDPFIPTSISELETYIKYHQPKNDIKSSLFPKWGNDKITSYADLSDTDKTILMEQYKLMLTTSESLTDRRQAVSSFYITLNCAIFAFLGAISTFSKDLVIFLIVSLVMCLFGVGLSIMWMKMIDSYGSLNNGKFKIINAIEKVLPAAVFDAEWVALQSQEKKKYVSFTEREKNTPKLFGIFYFAALIVVLVTIILLICGIIP